MTHPLCPACHSEDYAVGVQAGRTIWHCGNCGHLETTDTRVYCPDSLPANMRPAKPLWDATCPECGFTDDLDAFDVIGANDGNIFCPQCAHEFSAQPPARQRELF